MGGMEDDMPEGMAMAAIPRLPQLLAGSNMGMWNWRSAVLHPLEEEGKYQVLCVEGGKEEGEVAEMAATMSTTEPLPPFATEIVRSHRVIWEYRFPQTPFFLGCGPFKVPLTLEQKQKSVPSQSMTAAVMGARALFGTEISLNGRLSVKTMDSGNRSGKERASSSFFLRESSSIPLGAAAVEPKVTRQCARQLRRRTVVRGCGIIRHRVLYVMLVARPGMTGPSPPNMSSLPLPGAKMAAVPSSRAHARGKRSPGAWDVGATDLDRHVKAAGGGDTPEIGHRCGDRTLAAWTTWVAVVSPRGIETMYLSPPAEATI
ncbi:uncharacterized protein PgNI_11895 [Pyricularia grisea]|uniref:Uncharacterized protein n=1 Tax=Pyricularia grisea TaxID=148305 RepID=A0A6P8AQL9_PYRGI|nr:uncharacterized protein PgNI_11895 [Pyricularia grisea]TLD04352.1 hypothetical protein PgNI_11895 [Pyricularia grisea]